MYRVLVVNSPAPPPPSSKILHPPIIYPRHIWLVFSNIYLAHITCICKGDSSLFTSKWLLCICFAGAVLRKCHHCSYHSISPSSITCKTTEELGTTKTCEGVCVVSTADQYFNGSRALDSTWRHGDFLNSTWRYGCLTIWYGANKSDIRHSYFL